MRHGPLGWTGWLILEHLTTGGGQTPGVHVNRPTSRKTKYWGPLIGLGGFLGGGKYRTERREVNQGELLSEKSSDQEYLSAPLPNTLILSIEI